MHAVSINSNNLNEIYKYQQKQNDQRIQLPSLTIIHQSKLNASILSDFPSLIKNHKAYSKPKQLYNPQEQHNKSKEIIPIQNNPFPIPVPIPIHPEINSMRKTTLVLIKNNLNITHKKQLPSLNHTQKKPIKPRAKTNQKQIRPNNIIHPYNSSTKPMYNKLSYISQTKHIHNEVTIPPKIKTNPPPNYKVSIIYIYIHISSL